MADRQHPGFRTVDVRADPALIAVTSELPWPLDSGGHLRSYHVLSALAARFAVRLIAPRSAADTTSAEAVLALRRAGLDPHSIPVPPRSPAREARRILSSALRREPYVLFGRHRHRPVRIALEEMIASRPPALMYLDDLDSLLCASR